jgi:tetraacyldisaccharide 4'-kinase
VIDGERRFGNGLMLPAGPLREARARLRTVDGVVRLVDDGKCADAGEFAMRLAGDRFFRVNAPDIEADPSAFRDGNVHALAGIGNPGRFFAQLRRLGVEATVRAFPDHHRFVPQDIACPAATAILMTEKDAVKCRSFADDRCWMLPVSAVVDTSLYAMVEEKLRGFQTA